MLRTSHLAQTQFDANAAAGRRLAYVNAFMEGSTPRISAIWNSVPAGGLVARHGLDSAQYQAGFDQWTGMGYRTRSVTGYDGGGSARSAALWVR